MAVPAGPAAGMGTGRRARKRKLAEARAAEEAGGAKRPAGSAKKGAIVGGVYYPGGVPA